MGLIKNEQRVLGFRQNRASAEGKVCENEIVIGHHDVHVIQILARIKKGAAIKIAAMPVSALAVIGGYLSPYVIGYLLWPVIPVSVPLPRAVACQHFLKKCPGARLFGAGAVQKEQRHGIAVAVAFIVQPGFQARHTQIPAAAFGECPGEVHLAVSVSYTHLTLPTIY